MKPFRQILVVGAGQLGSQVAAVCAASGYSVSLVDSDSGALERSTAIRNHAFDAIALVRKLSAENVTEAQARIRATTDLRMAAKSADLVIESIVEDLAAKRKLLAGLARLCPKHAVFTTNSSQLLPSSLARSLSKPANFCSMHFSVAPWIQRVVDIMAHPGTAPGLPLRLCDFAESLGLLPFHLPKETTSYVATRMVTELSFRAFSLASRKVAIPEDIDRAFILTTGMPYGPFAIADLIGIGTSLKVVENYIADETRRRNFGNVKDLRQIRKFLQAYVRRGQLGTRTGEGFYKYPDPAFARPDFLEGFDSTKKLGLKKRRGAKS